MLPESLQQLIGRQHTFPDGASLTIREIKRRDENQHWVTFMVDYGHGIPIKQGMEYMEFITTYGHLFP